MADKLCCRCSASAPCARPRRQPAPRLSPCAVVPGGARRRRAARCPTSLALARRFGVVAWLAFASAGWLGCSDRDADEGPRAIAGCEGFSYQPCDILDESCQRELYALVGCVRGDPAAVGPPPVRLLDPASARDLVAAEAGVPGMLDEPAMMPDPSADERGFRAQVRGLELLGMLTPGQLEDEADVLDARVARTLAYYHVARQEIVIIDRGGPVDGLEANLTLAHEFVHAQQDARHGLGTFAAQLEVNSDAVLAIASLIEGEASIYQYLLEFAYSGYELGWIDYPRFFDDLVYAGTRATLVAGSPALTANSIFPYTFGTRFAGSLWLEGGSAGIDARFSAPPRGSRDVLALGAAGQESRTFDTDPAALGGFGLVVEDVAGAWVTAAVLPGLAEPARGRSALPALAARWSGDHLWIFDAAGGESVVAALWVIDWADAEAAALFATLAAELEREGAVLDIETRGTSSRVVAAERAEDVAAWRERLDEAVP